jgi:hypothetical protein
MARLREACKHAHVYNYHCVHTAAVPADVGIVDKLRRDAHPAPVQTDNMTVQKRVAEMKRAARDRHDDRAIALRSDDTLATFCN